MNDRLIYDLEVLQGFPGPAQRLVLDYTSVRIVSLDIAFKSLFYRDILYPCWLLQIIVEIMLRNQNCSQ